MIRSSVGRQVLSLAIALMAFFTFESNAHAVDGFEIQVYDGEINEIGKYSLENHLNHAFTGPKVDNEPGIIPPQGLTHLTFEFARGMTKYWELGFYFQTAMDSSPQGHYGGVKLRNKFVLPRGDGDTFHLGVNIEISDIPNNIESDQFGMEVRPIIGYENKTWKLLFNPILESALTGPKTLFQEFSPCTKVMYKASAKSGVGFEYYAGLGEFSDFPSLAVRTTEQYLYAAWDLLGSSIELNAGLGWGLTDVSSGLIAKMIFGFDF